MGHNKFIPNKIEINGYILKSRHSSSFNSSYSQPGKPKRSTEGSLKVDSPKNT